jgi:P4 family phage/plasmid primase-like protien
MTSLSLRSYLDTKRVSSADWNITGLGSGQNGWIGKYKIPADEYPNFLSLLHEHVFVKGRACSLVERHKAQSPILIDLDLSYPAGGPLQRRFGETQMREFVAAYADAFTHFFEPPAEPLQFFVSVKPSPEKGDNSTHKDGVHIVCPSVSTPPEIQYAIRGYLTQKGVIERIFGPTGNLKPEQDCFDKSVIQHANWFLYGACKPDKAWYKVEYVYSVTIPAQEREIQADDLQEEALDKWSPSDLVNLLSLQVSHDEPTPLVLRNADEWTQLVQRYGKGNNWAKTRTPAQPTATAEDPPPLALNDNMIQVSGLSARLDPNDKEIQLAYKLVEQCLNPDKRAKDYHNWVRLGLLLHNMADNETSYKSWVMLSRKVSGFANEPESTYRAKWTTLPSDSSALQRGVKPLTIATIHHYAKEDACDTYRKIMDNSYTLFAIVNCSGTHVSVADLVFDMYQHEFRCTPLKKGATAASMDWYQYLGHTWKNLKSSMMIRGRLSNDVRNKYMDAGKQTRTDIQNATNEDDRNRLDEKLKKLNKLETALQTSGFKDCVMKELTEKFYNEEFLQHMNQNPALVGFANGVLELRHIGADGQYHTHFRPGQPDDCISFQMGRGMVGLDAFPFLEGAMAYQPGADQPEYAEIMDFFTKIYPDPVLREYALTLFAACLEGANREQKFYIMTGVGSNGKSKIVELITKTFGEYQETIGTTALTRKRPDSGAANPDLVTLKCKRFVSMSEPDEGEKINTASMKQLSGEDTVKARALFQDQDQFVIMARIFMLCNDLPPVSSTDGGTWRRLRVIPHVAKFVDNDKPTDPTNHVYHKDLTLDSKIARWRPYFASVLVWYYENRYLRGGLKEPEQVAAASNKYKEENDVFAAFCQECLVREIGAEIPAGDVMIRYKDWLKFNPGKKVMTKTVILAKMGEVYGSPIDAAGKVFAGVRLVDDS